MSALLESIDAGFTLPPEWYSDPAIFEAEQRRILWRSWHFVTTTDRLAEVGDRFVWEIAGLPVTLVRAGDGDGAIVAADPGGAQVHVWGPMVWVNPAPDALTFAEWTAGADGGESLEERMRRIGCDVDAYVPITERVWDIPANWKVFQDNTIECYHCPTTHPEFSRAIVQDPERQILGIGGPTWVHHTLPFRDDDRRAYHFSWVFPTTYVQFTGRGFDVGSVSVLGVDRLRHRHIGFGSPSDTPERIAAAQAWLDRDPTIDQDVEICRLVQRALDSGVAPIGRLLAGREHLLTHLYRRIVEMMEA